MAQNELKKEIQRMMQKCPQCLHPFFGGRIVCFKGEGDTHSIVLGLTYFFKGQQLHAVYAGEFTP